MFRAALPALRRSTPVAAGAPLAGRAACAVHLQHRAYQGGLQDKDRIFKNLYGLHDWGLEGARRRGAWDGTKTIIDKGRDWIINEM